MNNEQLQRLEEQFKGVAEDLEDMVARVAQDISQNPDMSPHEMKFHLTMSLAQKAPVNTLLSLTSEAIHVIAQARIEK